MHRSESSLSSSDVQYALLWPESPTKFCPATGLLLGLSIPGQSVPNNSLALFSSDRDPESSVDRRNVFRFRSFLIMRRTEECDTPDSQTISLGLLLVPGWPSCYKRVPRPSECFHEFTQSEDDRCTKLGYMNQFYQFF